MEDEPPSYGSLNHQHCGLSYIDFLPGVAGEDLFYCNTENARFESVVDCANEWLSLNPLWKIITCESVEFKNHNGVINPTNMVYYHRRDCFIRFIRGLRLWLQTFPTGEEKVQKIGYVYLVPETEVPAGVLTHEKYENLDSMLLKFNNACRRSPLPGRIIAIETQKLKIEKGSVIDPNLSSWTEHGSNDHMRFIYVLRIFYEVCESSYGEIGITDFIPDVTPSKCCGAYPRYEYFSTLFEKVSHWCSSQSQLRICNIQSLEIKMSKGAVNTRKMSYTEKHKRRVRVLRVAHIRQQPLNYASHAQFSYKSFVPSELKPDKFLACFWPEVETLHDTMQRVSDWIQATGAKVLNVETYAVRLGSNGALHSSEVNYFCDRDSNQHYMYVIRAYLKGSYNEPFEDNSTPLRKIINPFAFCLKVIIILLIVIVFVYFKGRKS